MEHGARQAGFDLVERQGHGRGGYRFPLPSPTPVPATLVDRLDFWGLINFTVSPTGCWIWCGTRTRFGHGAASTDEGQRAAHRLAWELVCGAIDRDRVIRHDCDNAPCVNPAHLRDGSPLENRADMVERNRAPWQRPRLNSLTDRFVYAVCQSWAWANGLDPYAAWTWLSGRAPCPASVVDRIRSDLGVVVETATSRLDLVTAGAGL